MARRPVGRPSLDGATPKAERHKQTKTATQRKSEKKALGKAEKHARLGKKVRRATSHAKGTICPNAYVPAYVYSQSSQKAYEVACGMWSCSVCGWRKQQVAAYLARAGMQLAYERGEFVRMMTFTEDPKRPLDVPKLSACWNRLRTYLRKHHLLDQYAYVVETTQKGRPHIHALTTGKRIDYRDLSKYAYAAGFGEVCDIRMVHFDPDPEPGDRCAANYIAKEMSAYLSKQKKGDAFGKLVARRRRPMNTSKGWYPSYIPPGGTEADRVPGGLRRAEKELRELFDLEDGFDEDRDVGPWLFVIGDPLRTQVIKGQVDGESVTIRDRGHLQAVDSEANRKAKAKEEERSDSSDATTTEPESALVEPERAAA